MAPSLRKNTHSVDVQFELAKLRQSNQALHQMMNELFHLFPTSWTQSHESEHSNYCHDDFSNDDHSTSSSSIPKPTIILQWPMDYFVSNIFENGEECSKEDNITDWNSLPIYDEYLDEDCELFMGRQIVEDDDQSLFSQGEAITHTNDANFIVQIQKVTHFTEIGDFI